MNFGNRRIDHIVYAVRDLDEGISFIHEKLGVKASYGGRHLNEGTHNALINLSNETYLEIIAKDPTNLLSKNTWMGLDLLEAPCITRWAIKSSFIKEDALTLLQYDKALGIIQTGERKTSNNNLLKWKMTKPKPTPEVEIIPFITDWSQSSIHPTSSLPLYVKGMELKLYHPKPSQFQSVCKELLGKGTIIKSRTPKIELTLKLPSGKSITL